MHHPLFLGYTKIGMAINVDKRLSSYQTGCPNREYKLAAVWSTDNRHNAEATAHAKLTGFRVHNTEWFRIKPTDAVTILAAHLGDPYQQEEDTDV